MYRREHDAQACILFWSWLGDCENKTCKHSQLCHVLFAFPSISSSESPNPTFKSGPKSKSSFRSLDTSWKQEKVISSRALTGPYGPVRALEEITFSCFQEVSRLRKLDLDFGPDLKVGFGDSELEIEGKANNTWQSCECLHVLFSQSPNQLQKRMQAWASCSRLYMGYTDDLIIDATLWLK